MEKIVLNAQTRNVEQDKLTKIRTEKMVPGVLYGAGKENTHLKLMYGDLDRAYRQGGSNTIVDLKIDDQPIENVLIYDVTYDPITDRIEHVDFMRVRMDEKLTTKVPLEFIGLSKAVKDLGGVFIANFDELEVTCLPGDLPQKIEVDISSLNTFEDAIHVKEIGLPTGVEVEKEADEVVAVVVPPRSEEELAALNEEVKEDLEAVEVEKKGKEETEGEAKEEIKEEKK